MFHKRLNRQKAGKAIAAQTINRVIDLAERSANLRVSPPLAMMDLASGPLIYLSSSLELKIAKVGGSDITSGSLASPSSGDVTPYSPTGTSGGLTADSNTITAYNIWGTAVTANKACIIGNIGGSWYVMMWDC